MHYLDYAATTPVLDEVLAVMEPFQKTVFGNPSSVYSAGREAKKGLEEAREKVAAAVGAQPGEIVFTAGGTEADNTILKGIAAKRGGGHIITSAVEHHAIIHSAEWLERSGTRVTFLPVDRSGVVDLDALAAALTPQTMLVSVMTANNETGTIQPIEEVVRIVRERSKAAVHTDAVQALGKIPFGVDALDVDAASFSAHKIGGPKGVGALYLRKRALIDPLLHGGGQERDLRSGTPNVAGVVGFAAAAQIAAREVVTEGLRLSALRDRLEAEIKTAISSVSINGEGAPRVPGTLNLSIRGVEGESLLLMLDSRAIAASSGSACTSGSLDASHVLLAMGVPPEMAHGSLRFSLGRGTTPEDVDVAAAALPEIVERLRSLAPASVRT